MRLHFFLYKTSHICFIRFILRYLFLINNNFKYFCLFLTRNFIDNFVSGILARLFLSSVCCPSYICFSLSSFDSLGIFSFFWPCHAAFGILVPWPGIKPWALCSWSAESLKKKKKVQSSNHQSTREFPHWVCFYNFLLPSPLLIWRLHTVSILLKLSLKLQHAYLTHQSPVSLGFPSSLLIGELGRNAISFTTSTSDLQIYILCLKIFNLLRHNGLTQLAFNQDLSFFWPTLWGLQDFSSPTRDWIQSHNKRKHGVLINELPGNSSVLIIYLFITIFCALYFPLASWTSHLWSASSSSPRWPDYLLPRSNLVGRPWPCPAPAFWPGIPRMWVWMPIGSRNASQSPFQGPAQTGWPCIPASVPSFPSPRACSAGSLPSPHQVCPLGTSYPWRLGWGTLYMLVCGGSGAGDLAV